MGIRRWLLRMLSSHKPILWDDDASLKIEHGVHPDHRKRDPGHALHYVLLRPKVIHESLGDVEPQALYLTDSLGADLWRELAELFTSLADGTYVPEEE